ncbi:GPI mannosyltransferase 1 [Pleurotus pulmonarius]|nr:GPI mannosyltransferase 1 [Pleurotus pulmonarius]KAF4578891.1 GPI mannosyltransferase 1 [Pleurotus pulmonarius]
MGCMFSLVTNHGVPSFRTIVVASVALRVALIVYSEWHDAHSVVKYTDIDYRVFSDATTFLLHPSYDNHARGRFGHLVNLGDPYTRATYRYTPLLALLLAPNEWVHPSFGKYLFAACDILNGLIIHHLLVSVMLPRLPDQKNRYRAAALLTAAHLLNPLIFTISTRGSSESILASLVLATLYAALEDRWDLAALGLGVATHWKVYPVIYGFSCVAALSQGRSLLNLRAVRFTIISAGTFFALGLICYLIWGKTFLDEAYLYHLHRLDHRHNFSPYFYMTYLTYPSNHGIYDPIPLWRVLLRSPLVSFVPQMALSVGSGLLFGKSNDLPFTWFLQTALFVLFNKVCTSQYFLWYLILLPLIIPHLVLTRNQAIVYISVWFGTQALWLSEAYRLEFLGDDVFLGLWARSLIYVLGNGWVLAGLMTAYARRPVKDNT